MYRKWGKSVLDLVAGAMLAVLLAPLLLLVALLVRLQLGSPVFFTQLRAGYQGRPFKLYKFRSMRDLRDESGGLLADERRMTRFGNLLRRLSLDELPQLINVIRGEMSLVGPRPLLVDYLQRYSPRQARRHEVKPGITGWAQVNGRNSLDWETKFEHDVWYVEHLSLTTDLRILLRTLLRIFQPADVSAAGHATMPEFQGPSQLNDVSTCKS